MPETNYLLVIYNVWKYDKIITTEYYYKEKSFLNEKIDYKYTDKIKKKITKKLVRDYVNNPKLSFLKEFDSPNEIYIGICEIKFESVYRLEELLNYLDYMIVFYRLQKNYYQDILNAKIYDFSEMKEELIKIENESNKEMILD